MDFVAAIVINSTLIAFMFVAQLIASFYNRLPARGSFIPGTKQPFLYWQDFYCQKWGNTVGMPLMLAAFIGTYSQNPKPYSLIFWFVIGFLATLYFRGMCLSAKHKPDWGFPMKGKISLGGIIHLGYFWFYFSIIFFTVWNCITKPEWLMFGAGLIIYAITWHKDLRSGNFAPLIKQ